MAIISKLQLKTKTEKRVAKKKKRRYPMSGKSIFVIAKIKKS